MRSAVKLPRATWGSLPAVKDLEAKPLALPGCALRSLLVGPDRVMLKLELTDAAPL